MKRILALGLGVMTAIGGFVDVGNLVTSGITGARFGATLTWAIVVGTIGMIVYGEMAGRVSAVAGRAVFHAVRERLGIRTALLNLGVSLLLTVFTLAAELGGVGLTLERATSLRYLIWVPIAGLALWLVIWRLPFSIMENALGLLGLALLVFVIATFTLPTDWHSIWHQSVHPSVPANEGYAKYFFFAISLVGACIVPYQVLFFSSGGREQRWQEKDILTMRLNAFIGFPLGAVLSAGIMFAAIPVLDAHHTDVKQLKQVAEPAIAAFGTIGLVSALIGFFAATFAAGAECALTIGYMVSQFFGWPWRKTIKPSRAPQFHVAIMVALVVGVCIVLTTVDPLTVTLLAVVLGAASIPLTYLPILVVANDRDYMGKHVNGRFANAMGTLYLLISAVISVATIPLIVMSGGGG